jgi:DNA adenine methylase
MITDSLQLNLPVDFPRNAVLRDARPFVKWVGGKQQLLAQFKAYFPTTFRRYFEPFVGGGAVFFHLWNTGRLPRHAFLFDNNDELVNAYLVVRDKVTELIETLAIHKERHDKKYYYKIRRLDRYEFELSDVERAARTIYLNRTCYNGLYRVNSKGQFNVPMGSYVNPQILHEDVLRAASAALQGVNIEVTDFRSIVDFAQAKDLFYLDPPYDPLSKTASFTGYTPHSFGEEDQRELARVFALLAEKGAFVMLSNSNTPLVLDLYREFRIETVRAKRAVNSDANGRGCIPEVVVLNY